MRLSLALALILSLAGIPAAAVEVCAAFEQGASSGCCCDTEQAGEGEGVTSDCGCSMRRAPEPPATPDPAPTTTERLQGANQPASLAAGAVIPPAARRCALDDEDTVSRFLPTHLTLCTFRC